MHQKNIHIKLHWPGVASVLFIRLLTAKLPKYRYGSTAGKLDGFIIIDLIYYAFVRVQSELELVNENRYRSPDVKKKQVIAISGQKTTHYLEGIETSDKSSLKKKKYFTFIYTELFQIRNITLVLQRVLISALYYDAIALPWIAQSNIHFDIIRETTT